MKQCAARQFENELVERLSILADRHLRPPAPEGGTVSTLEYAFFVTMGQQNDPPLPSGANGRYLQL